jgi:hypothetical protein
VFYNDKMDNSNINNKESNNNTNFFKIKFNSVKQKHYHFLFSIYVNYRNDAIY